MKKNRDKPSHTVALLLATLTGCGVGHFYVGKKRRAVVWLASVSVALVLVAALFPVLGRSLGYRVALVVFCGTFLVGWLGPIIDLSRMGKTNLVRVPTLHVFVFWIGVVITTTVVRSTIRSEFIEAFKIPAGSMMPTVLVGDHMFVDKRGRSPNRGEVIVFRAPEHPEQDYVKRVIAVAGDRLEVKDGRPWINGWEVPYCRVGQGKLPGDAETPGMAGEVDVEFLDGQAYLTFYDASVELGTTEGPFEAAHGESWVLGDNRRNSYDSLKWFSGQGAGVPDSSVKGKALCFWMTVTDEGLVTSRIGASVMAPTLPPTLTALQADLDRCLASRPPREKTIPPARH